MLNALRREHGQDLVEYALIIVVLLVLLLGIVQFALIMFSYNTINDAARQAARFGVIVDAGTGYRTPTQIEAEAYRVTDAANLSRANVTATATLNSTTKQVRVVITYQVDMITALLGFPAMTLRAESTKRIEVE